MPKHVGRPPDRASSQAGRLASRDAIAPLRPILDGSLDGVLVADADGHCLAANQAAADLLGYTDHDWHALTLSDLLAVADDFREVELRSSGRSRARRQDGSIAVVDVWSTPVTGIGNAASLVYLRGERSEQRGGETAEAPAPSQALDAPAVVAVSLDGSITGWSPAAARLYGFEADEVVGRSIAKLAPTESIDDVASLLKLIRDGDRAASFRTSQLTQNGSRIDVCLHVGHVRDAWGDVASATVAVREAVECAQSDKELRKARASANDANRALRESEERFRGAFDSASIGMALVSPDGRFLLVNPALRGILLYGGNELLFKTFQDVTHPDDLDMDRDMARQLLAGEIDSYQIEKRFLRPDGETIWGRLTVSLVRDGAHRPRYFVAQVQDITPYKAAGVALREAEARYRTLVEQIPAAVYVDAGESLGTPRYISPRIEALLGYSPREWVDDPELWIRAIHPEDRDRILASIAGADGAAQPMHLEYRFVARDGREVWVHDQVALVRDEEGVGQYWQGFMVDITDRKRAEEELLLAKEAAEEANRLKSAFLSMATHELRTPLTIMSGYVEMLADSAATHWTPEEREFLDVAQTGTRTLAGLVDDLLDLARMESGRLDLAIRPVDVGEAIERVQRLVSAQAATKEITLAIRVAADLPPVAADLDRLVQVLFNLLGNAIKFTEQGSVGVTVGSGDGGIEFRVDDTGIGIAEEALPHIFDEFRQADAGTTRKFGGSGLGLAIAKRLVEMQSGTIAVESTVGAGSTFTVWLPAADSPSMDTEERLEPSLRLASTTAGVG